MATAAKKNQGKVSSQGSDEINADLRQASAPDTQEHTVPDSSNASVEFNKQTISNPFLGHTGDLHPYQDEDTLVNLELIHKLLHTTLHPIIVSGVQGCGKSTFLRIFSEQTGATNTNQGGDNALARWQVINLNVTNRSKPSRLIKMVAQALDLARAKTAEHLCRAINQQRITNRNSAMPLLVINNAHLLPDASVALISELNEHCTGRLRLILNTCPELLAHFQQEGSKLRIGINAHLLNIRPLTLQQTNDYINRRLEAAGLNIPFIMTDVQIARIYKQSAGVPGRINQIARQMCRASIQTPCMIPEASTGPSLWTQLKSFIERIELPRLRPVLKLRFLQKLRLVSKSHLVQKFRLIPTLSAVSVILLIGLFIQRDSIWSSDNTANTSNADIKQTASPKLENTPPNPFATNKAIIPATNIKPPKSVSAAVITKSAGPVKSKIAKKSEKKVKKIVKTKAAVKSSLKPGPAKPILTKLTPVVKLATSFRDKSWLLQQNPRHYIIQLMSARRGKTAEKYARAHQLVDNAAKYQIRYRGKIWHVLVYGEFNSRKDARARIRSFPEAIRNAKFRIRKLRYLQRELKRGVILPRKKITPVKPATSLPKKITL